ncbi:putative solute-binding protein [Acinetobacter sp. WU_MDCI_Abxc222]|uniref:putative solute-binding protein n=1 Tax=Acinetobacter sp. WU_MDCI_Abxc222 TaxID=2850076 RepID=UPI0021CD3560|nr:putative solute-binding protein [Acinetobacter sp. WU_MDCI_Abxc222]MCU4565111.1 RND transporter [Acinetobacter sp. WU_MDCI_Abxc222]
MKKRLGMIGAAFCCAVGTVHAGQNVCVFDLLGKSGESYKMMEEWALAAKEWQADITLIPFQDEGLVDRKLREGKCDAAYMTSMRARNYNKFAGSIDAIGGVTSNAIAQKAISYVLDKRNKHRMVTAQNGTNYEVVGIVQIGLAYLFVRDKNLNSIEKVRGTKFAILQYDAAQKIMVESVGAKPIPSEITDFVKKFNSGQVDAIAAPAYAYKPLEIGKGVGTKGAMFTFPVVNVTGDLIARSDKFPTDFGIKSRAWFTQQLPQNFAMVKRLEMGVSSKIKMNFSVEDKTKYQKILREGRLNLTKQGVYDATMMSVLKRARCTVERTNFECTLSGE